ncbi:MAG: glycosyltransferase family 2 protein [Actinomycetes bacterium]
MEATATVERRLPLLSVVVPMHDEQDTVRILYDRTAAALADVPFELVAVDDGSTDRTPEILAALAAEDPRVKVVRLSRCFGHQAALTAGLDAATGDAVVMMDGDLQDPPEVVPEMVERWRSGADVVYGVRVRREGETRFKIATARRFYRLMARMSSVPLAEDSGDFRLLDRRALDALRAMRERSRYLRGMTVWIGFTQTAVPYVRESRHAGRTKFSLGRMTRFALDAVASFSNTPLQVASVVGFWCAALAFAAIPVALGMRLADQFVPGVTTTVIAVLLLGGLQLMALGVLGEYLGRVYEEVKRRPLYVVRDWHNLDEPPDGTGP